MKIIRTINELNSELDDKKKIGFVPTMGALHEGHLSLIEIAKKHADCIVASIFVNPTQFAPHEDFDSYPRTEKEDAQKLKECGVDILFLPTEEVLYPNGYDSEIKSGDNAKGLETDFRPHFFDGVVNVVSRLFNAVKPDIAVFGEKDFQQLQVIKEMVDKYNMPIEIISAPIARDKYGLALSSRNIYLSQDELKIARELNKIIKTTSKTHDLNTAKEKVLALGFDKVDYIDIKWNRILCAIWLGRTRLIDNMGTE